MLFPHHYEYLHGLTALEEDAIEETWVIALDLIRVIFEDMNPIWLRTMWEDGGTSRVDMIKILILLALLKHKSRL
jgi:hypothetical protein